MKINLYAVRDDKVGSFNAPAKMLNHAAAVRQFGDLVEKDKDGLIGLHPADFSLWYIGTYDDETGALEQPDGSCCILARGSDFVKEND